MACVDGRMGGEHAAIAHRLQIVGKCAFGTGSRLWIAAQEREGEQRRMAFVEVIGGDLKTERPEQHFAADAEDNFLLEPQRLRPRRTAGR